LSIRAGVAILARCDLPSTYPLQLWGRMCSLCHKITHAYKKKSIEDGGRRALTGRLIAPLTYANPIARRNKGITRR